MNPICTGLFTVSFSFLLVLTPIGIGLFSMLATSLLFLVYRLIHSDIKPAPPLYPGAPDLAAFPHSHGYALPRESGINPKPSFPLRIAVAEDNMVYQLQIVHILKELGYDPILAENGKELLAVLETRPCHLVLMDIEMPEMDGLEATRMIRINAKTQPVIIGMIANASQSDRDKCLLSGMNDYINKPLEPGEISALLERWALKTRS